MRRDFYVYFHRDMSGNIFYVGKGGGKRAWSTDRHPAWKKYVSDRLDGKYSVEIFRDGLDELEAVRLENELIYQHGEHLVNWVNPRREFDYAALETYHRLRDANRAFVAETKALEAVNLPSAIDRYRLALERMGEYESLTLERGLVADLNVGPDWGDPNILDRLTLCLIRAGRAGEAITEAERYFEMFPSAVGMSVGKKIYARIEKLQAKGQNA